MYTSLASKLRSAISMRFNSLILVLLVAMVGCSSVSETETTARTATHNAQDAEDKKQARSFYFPSIENLVGGMSVAAVGRELSRLGYEETRGSRNSLVDAVSTSDPLVSVDFERRVDGAVFELGVSFESGRLVMVSLIIRGNPIAVGDRWVMINEAMKHQQVSPHSTDPRTFKVQLRNLSYDASLRIMSEKDWRFSARFSDFRYYPRLFIAPLRTGAAHSSSAPNE